jgi:hypothetical protein
VTVASPTRIKTSVSTTSASELYTVLQYTGLLGTGPAGQPALLSGGAAALMFK